MGNQPSINDTKVLSPLAHATHLSASSQAPLGKRINRIGVISEVDMSEAVGEKRSLGSITTKTELPKKRRVS